MGLVFSSKQMNTAGFTALSLQFLQSPISKEELSENCFLFALTEPMTGWLAFFVAKIVVQYTEKRNQPKKPKKKQQ